MFKDTREPPVNGGNQREEPDYDRGKIINLAEYRLSRQQAAGAVTNSETHSTSTRSDSKPAVSMPNTLWQRVDSIAAIATGFAGGGAFLGIGIYGGNPPQLIAGLAILGLAGFKAIEHWREYHH